MRIEENKKILISGASIAGLSTAYWMNNLGYQVTIVEIGKQIRSGGTAVDITEDTLDIVKRMGIFEQLKDLRLNLEKWEFKNANDITEGSIILREEDAPPSTDEIEIERDNLINVLYSIVKDNCLFVFNNFIIDLKETDNDIEVTFNDDSKQSFDLVIGCDGIHSGVRKIWFGNEDRFSQFLGQYFSISIVNKSLIKPNTGQMYNVPGKAVMLNAYKDMTDIVLSFRSEQEIPYDYRNEKEQRKIIMQNFKNLNWRVPELLKEINNSSNFYFDKLCQIKMSSWSKGRVVLVGDAGYCASPASGMGGSLALMGAAKLADFLSENNGDYKKAFEDYNNNFHPFIEEVQENAVKFGLETLVPTSEEAIQKRNLGSTSF